MYVLSKNIKNIKSFLMKFSIFTAEKNLYIARASFRNAEHGNTLSSGELKTAASVSFFVCSHSVEEN